MNVEGAIKIAKLRIDAIDKAILYIHVAYIIHNNAFINRAHESMLLAKRESEIELENYIRVANEMMK